MIKIALDADELLKLEITEKAGQAPASASKVNWVSQFPPQQLILLFSDGDWEEFIAEWAHYQKKQYHLVARLGGSNDYGVDVACFHTSKGFLGAWDNFQCKHYKSALAPNEAIPEVGKILWHIYKGHLTKPDNYYFFSPKDSGPTLKKLLFNSVKLKAKLIEEWDNWCSGKITKTQVIELSGPFLKFVEEYDFSSFKYKPSLEVIDEHRKTPYFVVRFGGGLPDRPESKIPPDAPKEIENRYIQQLFEAYSDCKGVVIQQSNLCDHTILSGHYSRSRETFYEAESLRIFARDSVPAGTFEKLKDQVYHGVVDVEEDDHEDGFQRVKAVVKTAATLNVNASGLMTVIEVKDLHGMCHQLANEDLLTWRRQ